MAAHMHVSHAQNITTRDQLIEIERRTRKLVQQKRDEKKDAFLSAQKQLLKTTEYIQQLHQLSLCLSDKIQSTQTVLANLDTLNHNNDHSTVPRHDHYVSTDINLFGHKKPPPPPPPSHSHVQSTFTSTSSDAYGDIDVDALIGAFNKILCGDGGYDETYLMSHVDVPFLATYHDLPLFLDNIQSCLYSACMHVNLNPSTSSTSSDEDDDEDEEEKKMESSSTSACVFGVDQYGSFLNAREILIEQLLQCMLSYPQSQSVDDRDTHELSTSYYEQILPFCLFSLLLIQYESAAFVHAQQHVDTDKPLHALFHAFMEKNRAVIEQHTTQCLQSLDSSPSLLIACLNAYHDLLDTRGRTLQWNALLQQLRTSSPSQSQLSCVEFMSEYSFHASFYQCFASISKLVCESLRQHFTQLLAKLSDANRHADGDADGDSFADIMNRIQRTLSSILTIDNHAQLLRNTSLSRYLDAHITASIETSTTHTMREFIAQLEAHLNRDNMQEDDTDSKQQQQQQLQHDEYLEIGICCEKLQCFIEGAIREYQSQSKIESTASVTPISQCLMNMLSSIASLKSRALQSWSSALSSKLFGDLDARLQQMMTIWNASEAFLTKTTWKSIVIDTSSEMEADVDEATIIIPCHPSQYVHEICFQFIQVLLLMTTQSRVPHSMVELLETELRSAISTQLHGVFVRFLEQHQNRDTISEMLGLQLYFDVEFARCVLSTQTRECRASWQQILRLITDGFIELVAMEYAQQYIDKEIHKNVNACLLMYGVQQWNIPKEEMMNGGDEQKTNSNKKRNETTTTTTGGNIFAIPKKKIPRIAALPVASYQISQSVADENRSSSLNSGSIRGVSILNAALLDGTQPTANTKETITKSLNQITSGAMSHANSLLKNFWGY